MTARFPKTQSFVNASLLPDRRERASRSVHLAGHAVACVMAGHPVPNITLDDRGGCPSIALHEGNVGDVHAAAVTVMAGAAAERAYTGANGPLWAQERVSTDYWRCHERLGEDGTYGEYRKAELWVQEAAPYIDTVSFALLRHKSLDNSEIRSALRLHHPDRNWNR